ncbi:augmin complex subunit wac [Drosophila pseudoobscura]|uniref:Augmin complex subunit wac n=1 Tax=Drosophila pseudoobscura pseudoobscura TaxID=46245 RepID=A0A6I8W836_DROPS|nr:augmin complex subunit wac [Drosophila pseudoobscura]
MENLKLQEEIKALKDLGQHYESLLKMAGVELRDFSNEDLSLLSKSAQLYADLGVHELELNYLNELYYGLQKDRIENNLIIAQQQTDLQRIKTSIDETSKDVAVLERFKSAAEKQLIPDGDVQLQRSNQLATKQALLDRQRALEIPKDFNIESIMQKVHSLERKE